MRPGGRQSCRSVPLWTRQEGSVQEWDSWRLTDFKLMGILLIVEEKCHHEYFRWKISPAKVKDVRRPGSGRQSPRNSTLSPLQCSVATRGTGNWDSQLIIQVISTANCSGFLIWYLNYLIICWISLPSTFRHIRDTWHSMTWPWHE